MTPNPILKVLSTLSPHHVQHLLMGGQACVLYGAAEFSRDTDIVLMTGAENLRRLSSALDALDARRIAVPPLSPEYLQKGHAIHFRCHQPDAKGMRVDVMSVMRGVAPFEELWPRRTTVELGPDTSCEVISLPDLVQAKKTQRDKDWPMIRRLVEANYAQHAASPTSQHVAFWLREARTVGLLLNVAEAFPELVPAVEALRPLLCFARVGQEARLAEALEQEEKREREIDRVYWAPLRQELEELRRR